MNNLTKIVFLTFIFVFIVYNPLLSQEYHIGSYNIRVSLLSDTKKGNGWSNRVENLCNLLLFCNFDIFGLQEDTYNQVKDIEKRIKDEYFYTGIARDDGKRQGPLCSIFYKKEIFQLIASNTFWLSDTPEKISKGWDAQEIRIITYARLKDKRNNTEISVFNLHLDHLGKLARYKSCKLLLKKIEDLCKINDQIIVTGDFNFYETSNNLEILNKSKFIKDTYAHSKHRWIPVGTCGGFYPQNVSSHRIDYIWVSKTADVLRFGVLNNFYLTIGDKYISDISQIIPDELKQKNYILRNPSDHYPISASVKFNK